MHRNNSIVLSVTLVILIALSSGVSAETLSESSKLVCSSIDVIACKDGRHCADGSSQSFELPEFMFINFKDKTVRAKNHDGNNYVSPIKNFEITKSQLIIQGIENHRGWSAAIDRKTGRLTISSVGDEVSIMIFGACTTI